MRWSNGPVEWHAEHFCWKSVPPAPMLALDRLIAEPVLLGRALWIYNP
jgi:hypothetical protein